MGVDIHPAAKMGKGIMIDHAHSIVIGETASVGRQRVDAAFRDAGPARARKTTIAIQRSATAF